MRQYLTTAQVAQTLGVSLNTIYRWLKAEKIPEPYRNPENNYRLWTVEDLEQLRGLCFPYQRLKKSSGED